MNYIEKQMEKWSKLSLKITCGELSCIGNKDCSTKKMVEAFLLTSLNGLVDEIINKLPDVKTYNDPTAIVKLILDQMKFNPEGR